MIKMKVKELIQILEKVDENLDVILGYEGLHGDLTSAEIFITEMPRVRGEIEPLKKCLWIGD
jgi:hypothetical protein